MELKVNDSAIDNEQNEAETIGELLKELRHKEIITKNQVVVSLDLDSQTWMGTDLDDLQEMPIAHIGEFDMKTEDRQNYLQKVLSEVNSGLDVMIEATSKLAEEFRKTPSKDTNLQFFNLLDSLQQVLLCTYQIQDASDKELGINLNSTLNQISSVLDALTYCQENEDWEGIADIFDKKLLNSLEDIKGSVTNALGKTKCETPASC